MQLSELEEEMDQRIQAAEHKTRKDVSLWDWPVYAMNPWTTFCVQGTGHSLGYGTSRLPQALSTKALLVLVLRGIDEGKRDREKISSQIQGLISDGNKLSTE